MAEAGAELEPSGLDAAAAAAGDESPYMLHARMDIAAVLRDIVRTRALATVHFGAGRDTLLTPVLAVDSAAGEIVFDCGGSQRLNHALLRATKLHFFSSHDKVKVRFSTGPARVVQRDGRQAFAARIPESMLRLQRREFYRVLAPVACPLRCVVPIAVQDSLRHAQTRVHDMSQGGVSVVAPAGEMPVDIGAQYANCRIVLPQAGNVIVTLETTYMHDLTLLNGKTVVRTGCRFVHPSMSALALMQRYLMKLEREKKSRD